MEVRYLAWHQNECQYHSRNHASTILYSMQVVIPLREWMTPRSVVPQPELEQVLHLHLPRKLFDSPVKPSSQWVFFHIMEYTNRYPKQYIELHFHDIIVVGRNEGSNDPHIEIGSRYRYPTAPWPIEWFSQTNSVNGFSHTAILASAAYIHIYPCCIVQHQGFFFRLGFVLTQLGGRNRGKYGISFRTVEQYVSYFIPSRLISLRRAGQVCRTGGSFLSFPRYRLDQMLCAEMHVLVSMSQISKSGCNEVFLKRICKESCYFSIYCNNMATTLQHAIPLQDHCHAIATTFLWQFQGQLYYLKPFQRSFCL